MTALDVARLLLDSLTCLPPGRITFPWVDLVALLIRLVERPVLSAEFGQHQLTSVGSPEHLIVGPALLPFPPPLISCLLGQEQALTGLALVSPEILAEPFRALGPALLTTWAGQSLILLQFHLACEMLLLVANSTN